MKKQVLVILTCISFSGIINAVAWKGGKAVDTSGGGSVVNPTAKSLPGGNVPPVASALQPTAASLRAALASGVAAHADVEGGLKAGLTAGGNPESAAYKAALTFASGNVAGGAGKASKKLGRMGK